MAAACGRGREDAALADISGVFEHAENPWAAGSDSMPDKDCAKLKTRPIGGTLGRVFNDSNHVHLGAAMELGFTPIEDPHTAWYLLRPIEEVKSCREYYVDSLTHSYPYLVPEAAELLKEIGRRFNDTLEARGGGNYRIKVTSVTRSRLSVGKLRRVNRNATEASAHQYGTTFDISYLKFAHDGGGVNRTQEDLKNLLAEVLNDLRNEGRCYVKHERKQSCFHITARTMYNS
ncbi:MAG: DUF5715 family protein [Clostridium sp.]|nr:DUF5715 family protein [Clostridium sp.]